MKYFKLYEYEKMAKIMRYSAWNQETIFSSVSQIDTDFTAYKDWYKAGHPRIGAIYSITVEEYQDEYNGNYCSIKGNISTPDGGYTYYANLIMSSTTTDNLFIIYDIVRE